MTVNTSAVTPICELSTRGTAPASTWCSSKSFQRSAFGLMLRMCTELIGSSVPRRQEWRMPSGAVPSEQLRSSVSSTDIIAGPDGSTPSSSPSSVSRRLAQYAVRYRRVARTSVQPYSVLVSAGAVISSAWSKQFCAHIAGSTDSSWFM